MTNTIATKKKDYPGITPLKPAMVHVNLRISEETLAYYKQFNSYTAVMREVLTTEAKENGMFPK